MLLRLVRLDPRWGAAEKDIPDMSKRFEAGDLLTLRNWLKENIHQHGRHYRAKKLCLRVTGKPLSHKPLIDYMTAKYRAIYGF